MRKEASAVDLPKRKPLRLPEYDYSSPGAYFVTGCTQPELVQYLKERRLYVNEPVCGEEEV